MQKETQETCFSELYNNTCQDLRSSGRLDEVMKHFMQLKTNLERVEYVSSFESLSGISVQKQSRVKDEKEAQILEQVHDKQIVQEEMHEKSLASINKCLKLTPLTNKFIVGQRYRKRAWNYLLLERFHEADIDARRSLSLSEDASPWNSFEIRGHCLAKSGNFKEAKEQFLEALNKLRCCTHTSQEEKAQATQRICVVMKTINVKKKPSKNSTEEEELVVPAPTGGRHSVLTSASSKIDLFWVKNKGRGVFAVKDIYPGDVVISEKPFSAVLSTTQQDGYCIECLSRLYAPIPCDTCTTVWFCSEKCKESQEDHKKECAVLSCLADDDLGKMAPLVFRILASRNWKKARGNSHIQNLKNESDVVIFEKGENIAMYNLKKLRHKNPMDGLVTNEDQRTFGDFFKRTVSSIFIAKCLSASGVIKGEIPEQVISTEALHHIQACSCNAYEIMDYRISQNVPFPGKVFQIGGAIYPTISLTNHSCSPNVVRYSVGKTCVLRATSFIPKGTEVFDNYGFYFHSCPKSNRLNVLKSQYLFDCNCEACINNWPIYTSDADFLTLICSADCQQTYAYSENKSSVCKHCKRNTKSKIDLTKKSLDGYERSKLLLQRKDFRSSLPILLKHQHFLNLNAKKPSRHCSEVQETITHCYYSLGNSSVR